MKPTGVEIPELVEFPLPNRFCSIKKEEITKSFSKKANYLDKFIGGLNDRSRFPKSLEYQEPPTTN